MDALFLRQLWAANDAAMREAAAALTAEIMALQAEGRYAKGQALLRNLAHVRPDVPGLLERPTRVPVDIAPRFTTASALR